ncbi:GNAT family N-acetyltransferase [Arthrobacter halodurans]|uniref:GNAT family N-acetyltransferase n=1 Tax=Arthrobacter halodurans TaxID=516699 RepID=A0ABV4UQI3_9MICC
MLPIIDFALSYAPPSPEERASLSLLSACPDDRWHQKLDHTLFSVTALHQGTRVGFGIVHTSVTAPTAVDRPLELGAMFVHPAYRRLGIREHIAEARLTYALSSGGTPITVIDNRNDASWRYYERSPQWAVEREYTGYFTGLPMTIWVSSESAWFRDSRGLAGMAAAPASGTLLPEAGLPLDTGLSPHGGIPLVEPAVGATAGAPPAAAPAPSTSSAPLTSSAPSTSSGPFAAPAPSRRRRRARPAGPDSPAAPLAV